MADNTTINAGTGGDIIATDEIKGVKHQQVKIEFGPDGGVTRVDTPTGSRLPVENSTVERLLEAILIELRVITLQLRQGFNLRDDPEDFRDDSQHTQI